MKFVLVCILLSAGILYAQRSIHRPKDPLIPSIEVWSTNDPTHRYLTDEYLRPIPLLRSFDHEHFKKNLVPAQGIRYDNNSRIFTHIAINRIINNLLKEIRQRKKTYTDFIILKDSGFARRKQCGLLILKFKHYPFVLKLFMEPPQSFVNPYDKGFEVACIFSSGGSLRHTLGFSRIKTLNYVREKIKNNPRWRDRIILPRKWFWQPEKPCWLHIKTHNLGSQKTEHIIIPSLYGIIADELIKDPSQSADHTELMAFSKFLEHRIDPHTKNFFIEKNTKKIALIDTELFPLILGFTQRIDPQDSYLNWYMHLAGKFVRKRLGSTKAERHHLQQSMCHYYVS